MHTVSIKGIHNELLEFSFALGKYFRKAIYSALNLARKHIDIYHIDIGSCS
jgi:hypothetical protein